ncbi:MAG: hypothetical protein ACREDW_01445, partial [Aestuariivirgaceae bacterium]
LRRARPRRAAGAGRYAVTAARRVTSTLSTRLTSMSTTSIGASRSNRRQMGSLVAALLAGMLAAAGPIEDELVLVSRSARASPIRAT